MLKQNKLYYLKDIQVKTSRTMRVLTIHDTPNNNSSSFVPRVGFEFMVISRPVIKIELVDHYKLDDDMSKIPIPLENCYVQILGLTEECTGWLQYMLDFKLFDLIGEIRK